MSNYDYGYSTAQDDYDRQLLCDDNYVTNYKCDNCGEYIREGKEAFKIPNGDVFCEDCIDIKIAERIRE